MVFRQRRQLYIERGRCVGGSVTFRRTCCWTKSPNWNNNSGVHTRINAVSEQPLTCVIFSSLLLPWLVQLITSSVAFSECMRGDNCGALNKEWRKCDSLSLGNFKHPSRQDCKLWRMDHNTIHFTVSIVIGSAWSATNYGRSTLSYTCTAFGLVCSLYLYICRSMYNITSRPPPSSSTTTGDMNIYESNGIHRTGGLTLPLAFNPQKKNSTITVFFLSVFRGSRVIFGSS